MSQNSQQDYIRTNPDYSDVWHNLFKDHTTQRNIIWATDDYKEFGFGFYDEIQPENLLLPSGEQIIKPRSAKTKDLQLQRTRDKAEVFTPSWVCNVQNNLIDEAWFGRKDVFNQQTENDHSWITNPDKIEFPEGKTWRDYVRAIRLEICCGEAPYIASVYDTTTGNYIDLKNRIGLLDRKLRVINENIHTSTEWLDWVQIAYKSIYAFEFQGDSLLTAREMLLYTFLQHYREKFGKDPIMRSINYIAYIISWNIWQMDGLKMVIPGSCEKNTQPITDLFGNIIESTECPACKNGDLYGHIGTKCLIRDWRIKDCEKQKIPFVQLIRK